MHKLAINIFLCGLIGGFVIVNSLDCSLVVKEHSSGVLNWLADVGFIVPVNTDENGWTMLLTFDQQFTGVGVWDVWVVFEGSEKWARLTNREENAVLKAGDPLEFRFRVNYYTNVTKPQVASMTFQGIELCQ